MKRILLTSLIACSVVGLSHAAKVSPAAAADYGRTFLNSMSGRNDLSVRNTEMVTDGYIIVNYFPQGWAILSADDTSEPIIGYSLTGSVRWGTMPSNMRFMLGEFSKAVKFKAQKGGLPHRNWSTSVAGVESRSTNVVEPLIKVNWNQSAPYNKYCPGTGTNKAIVGCVAVAMSQAMSVQRYPGSPKGSVSYSAAGYGLLSIDFDFERAYNWDAILSGANSYDEAARLMYHAGMSVFMGYGADGSGIPSNQIYRISDALVNNFGYSKDAVKYFYRDQLTPSEWERRVQNELYAGRAVVYNAIDPNVGGHSFNVDGIDADGRYHLNWGWGGQSNGYLSLDNLRDPYMNFTTGHRLVIGIGNPNNALSTLELSDTEFEQNLPAGSVLGTITVNGKLPEAEMKLSLFGRGEEDEAQSTIPFVLDGHMVKSTRVLTATDKNFELMIKVEYQGETLTQGYVINVSEPQPIAASTRVSYNRSLGRFMVRTKHNVSYTLKSEDGTLLSSGVIDPIPELTFMRDDLSEGVNTLTLTCGQDEKVIKIKNSNK